MTAFAKFPKLLAEFHKVLNFEKLMIYVLPKFNLNITCAGCNLYYLVENLIMTQNVYNDTFSNVDNEFIVANVRN